MTSEADRNCPEGKDFVDVIEYLKDPWNKEKLHCLLSDEAWKRFVAAAKLSRDEADALYANLSQLETFMGVEDQEHRERFMKEFPQVKQDLEDRIRKLYALADEVDKVHKNCIITQVVAICTGAASKLLPIAEVCLAPFTEGISLVPAGTEVGLSIAASVAGMIANIVDMSKDDSAKAEATRLMSTGSDTEKVVEEVLHRSTPEIASLARKCFESLERIVKKADVFKADESNSPSTPEALDLNIQKSDISESRILQHLSEDFMSKEARAAVAGVFLLKDVVDLVKESKHLHEGAKAESAGELRQQAQELERRLEELTRIHKSLQEDLTP